MSRSYLVRVGTLGHVGRFTAVDAIAFRRGDEVVVRTARGLETGEVLAHDANSGASDGSLLRPLTAEDRMVQERLDRHKAAAFEACVLRLQELDVSATLMDVELLLDGQGLYFHFLGEVTPEVEAITAELAAVYEAEGRIRSFADAMTIGCGPGCGSEEAAGSGCTSCGTGCAIAGACGTRKSR